MTQESTNQPVTIQVAFDWLKLLSIALVGVGFFGLWQLAWAKFNHAINICPINSGMGCDIVVRSVYSQIGPLPVSYLGLVGYVVILAILLFESHLPFAKGITFGLTLFGFLFSGYLTAIEAFRLHTWCQLCVIVALAMTGLFILSLIRLWKAVGVISEDEDSETLDEAVE